MPVCYFKCESCGAEAREIAPQSRYCMSKNSRGAWCFDYELYKKLGPEPKRTHICEGCGGQILESSDPEGRPVKFLFNYFSDDC